MRFIAAVMEKQVRFRHFAGIDEAMDEGDEGRFVKPILPVLLASRGRNRSEGESA